MALSISNSEAITCADAVVDSVDTGSGTATLVIYSGTPPASVDAALSGNTALATVNLPNPAFGAAADASPGATATLLGVPLSDSSADASGTAEFVRFLDRDGTPRIQDDVATSGSTGLILNSLTFQAGRTFTVLGYTLTMAEVAS